MFLVIMHYILVLQLQGPYKRYTFRGERKGVLDIVPSIFCFENNHSSKNKTLLDQYGSLFQLDINSYISLEFYILLVLFKA